MILGLDTSTALTSVAVVADDGTLVAERRHLDPRRHAEAMAPLLAEVLAETDVSAIRAIACGVGPGPYTGLRVAIATGIALGAAWDVPVHGLCSLDAVAAEQRALAPGLAVVVATDARRSEAYWASYGADGARVEGPRVSPRAEVAAELSLPDAAWVARRVGELLAAGSAAPDDDVALDAHGEDTGATARALAGAGLLRPRPLYLRRPDAVAAVS